MALIPAPATAPTSGAKPPVPKPATAPVLSTVQKSAFDQVKAQLDMYGLGSLSQFVYNEIVSGKSSDEVARDLRQTPEFAARFPGIVNREKAGLPAISPGEYVSYENTATQLMRAAGLPKGFYDSPDDFTALISGDVSPAELNDRISLAKEATYNLAPEDANRLHQEFGLAQGSGALAAFYLDPQKALPLLNRQFEAAKIGGAADRAGYQGISNETAQGLAAQGVTDAQAAAGFSQLQHNQSLFHALPGEADPGITQLDQLHAVFGQDADAQQRIEAERSRRLAAFGDGGAFVTTSKGAMGLGTSGV